MSGATGFTSRIEMEKYSPWIFKSLRSQVTKKKQKPFAQTRDINKIPNLRVLSVIHIKLVNWTQFNKLPVHELSERPDGGVSLLHTGAVASH
jgi:hypothetical protein